MRVFRSPSFNSRLRSTIPKSETPIKRGHFLLSSFEIMVISSLLRKSQEKLPQKAPEEIAGRLKSGSRAMSGTQEDAH
jgi:hypothetical protein